MDLRSLSPTVYRPAFLKVVLGSVFCVRLCGRRRCTHTILNTLHSRHISHVYTPWTKRMQFLMQQLDLTIVVLIVSRKDGVGRVAAEALRRWPFRTELGPKRCRTDSRYGEDACERAGGGCYGVLQCYSAREVIVVVGVSDGAKRRSGVRVGLLGCWRVCAGHFACVSMKESKR